MNRIPRKTTPKVIGGKVQRKNRSAETPNYYNTPQDFPAIDRRKPGREYRHVLRKRDLVDFISILPDWDTLSVGLQAVILAPGQQHCDGWYDDGVVAVCAWEKDFWRRAVPSYYHEHSELFRRLGVPCEKQGEFYLCKFEDRTARAFQLLHILLHELGHHHDRMTTKRKQYADCGESYAEQYAHHHESKIWNRYQEVFDSR